MENIKEKKPLTENQEQVFETIRSTDGGYLKHYRRTDNAVCWKLVDKNHNPIQLFGEGVIKKLIEKGYLIKKDQIIIVA
jgi:hypothetical protein